MGLGKGGDGDKGVDTGLNAVALIALVKLPRGVVSGGTKLYPDLPLLRRAFAWVLHPMFGSSTASRY